MARKATGMKGARAGRRQVRCVPVVAAGCTAFALWLPLPATAQFGAAATPFESHRLAADVIALGSLAEARLSRMLSLQRLADDDASAAAGWDNAHARLTPDEARADEQLNPSPAIVQLPAIARLDSDPHAWWIDVAGETQLAVLPPAGAQGRAVVTVRLATQPAMEFDVGLIDGTAIIVRDARLHGSGGRNSLSSQTDAVELEWRHDHEVGWASMVIGRAPQGLSARLLANLAL